VAQAEADELGLDVESARADLNIAGCLVELDRLEEARRSVERAEQRFAALGIKTELLRARLYKAEIMRKGGDPEQALRELEKLKPDVARSGMMPLQDQVDEGIEKAKAA
jgi:uroporphyrinogen-III synthase